MGYTHYWRFSKNPKDISDGAEKFKKAVKLAKKAISMLPEEIEVIRCTYDEKRNEFTEIPVKVKMELGNGVGEGDPVYRDDAIVFNGKGDQSYETFAIELNDESYNFNFCKTARQPYDVAVCLALLCFKECFGDDIKVTSDGDMNEDLGWVQAKKIMKKL